VIPSLPSQTDSYQARPAVYEHLFVTAQGDVRGQYRRAIERKFLGAEMLLHEMRKVDLLEALDYLALLVELSPARAPRAAVRWHGRLETEAPMLTLPKAHLALGALAALCEGDRDALGLLRQLVRHVRPTLVVTPMHAESGPDLREPTSAEPA
jgi:hypothetical protein